MTLPSPLETTSSSRNPFRPVIISYFVTVAKSLLGNVTADRAVSESVLDKRNYRGNIRKRVKSLREGWVVKRAVQTVRRVRDCGNARVCGGRVENRPNRVRAR